MADEERWTFERIGLGYRVTSPRIGTEIRVIRLKRTSGEIHGEIRVTTKLAGIKTRNGTMLAARFNLSSTTTRERLAKLLESRTPGQISKMDWYDGLEALCQEVMNAESIGQPYLEVGQTTVVNMSGKYLLDPIVPFNVASIFYGPGGSGKSVLALAGAMSVRTGWQFIPGIVPTTHGPVLYLDWETDAPVINERIQAIAAGAGMDAPLIHYRRCLRPLYEEAEEIAVWVAEQGVIYVIIDSAGMAMGSGREYGDANESTMRLFDAIRHINVTTQVIDHVSKQEMRSKGKVTGLLPYGSIYKINLSRAAWEVRNGTSVGDDVVSIALIHTKANDSKLLPQIGLEVDWQPGRISLHEAEPVFEPVAEAGVQEAILQLLSDGGLRQKKDIVEAMADRWSSNTVYWAIRELKKHDRIIESRNGVRVPVAVDVEEPPGGILYRN